jgi:hypothetical protein
VLCVGSVIRNGFCELWHIHSTGDLISASCLPEPSAEIRSTNLLTGGSSRSEGMAGRFGGLPEVRIKISHVRFSINRLLFYRMISIIGISMSCPPEVIYCRVYGCL